MLAYAEVTIRCDQCGDEATMDLSSTGDGYYSSSGVAADLKGHGWTVDGDKHYCADCQQVREEDDDDESEED